MRVYFACLAAYNAGVLHGCWVDLDGMDEDDLQEQIDAMLAKSPEPIAEEWAVHDYEDLPSSLGEHPTLESLAKIAEVLEEHEPGHVRAILDNYCLDEAFAALERGFAFYDSRTDHAYELVNGTHDLSDFVQMYFDYEKFGRDLELGGDYNYISYSGGVLAIPTR